LDKSPFAQKILLNILLAYLSLFYFGLIDNIRGPLYPEILTHFKIHNNKGTWFFALASGTAILSGSLFPWLAHRVGTYWAFMTGVFFCVVSQFVFAGARHFEVLLLGSWALGVGIGLIGVAQNILVLTAATRQNLTRLMNGLHANYAGSSLIAPLIVALVFHYTQSFRGPFLALGLLGILTFLYFLKSREVFEVSDNKEFKDQSHRLQKKHIYFATVLSAYVVGEVLLATRLAQFMRDVHGASLEASSYWTTSFFVGLFFARLVFTFTSVSMLIRTQLLLGLFSSALFFALGLRVSPWFFVLVGISMAPCYALVMSWMSERAQDSLRVATTSAIVSSGIFIVTMHLVAGQITDLHGVSVALWVGVAFLVLSGVLILMDKKLLG
jgi:fucose permease